MAPTDPFIRSSSQQSVIGRRSPPLLELTDQPSQTKDQPIMMPNTTESKRTNSADHTNQSGRSTKPIARPILPPLGEERAPGKTPDTWRQQSAAARLHRRGFRRPVGRRCLGTGAGDVDGQAPAERLAPAGGGLGGGEQLVLGGHGAPADRYTEYIIHTSKPIFVRFSTRSGNLRRRQGGRVGYVPVMPYNGAYLLYTKA